MTPRLLLIPVALCLLAPAAHATGPGDYVLRADCGYDLTPWAEVTAGDLTVGRRDEYHGTLYGFAALYDPADPSNPVSASVRCEIKVNGVPAVTTPPAHGTTFVAAAGLFTLTPSPTDTLSLCVVVDLDAGGTYERCFEETQSQIPPQEIGDAIHALTGTVVDVVGPVLCAVTGDDVVLDSPVPFSVAAGSRYGTTVDVSDDDLRYDCP